ncbi:hypothetical protein [Corallococcus sp. CA054B]|uniref:hypothetical protein n=1 Tax=Corallococcus sp. CA054B TaxID=2316734 RepID=UPI001F360A21|nr:hypothetical protein [Corallococcus sp. CA054B]
MRGDGPRELPLMKTHRPSNPDGATLSMRKTASAEAMPLVDPLLSSQIGDFTVEERIGEGGMGVVYRATHSLIGKQAVIKVLRAELVSPQVHERLLVGGPCGQCRPAPGHH